jgi:hypothetical protein
VAVTPPESSCIVCNGCIFTAILLIVHLLEVISYSLSSYSYFALCKCLLTLSFLFDFQVSTTVFLCEAFAKIQVSRCFLACVLYSFL